MARRQQMLRVMPSSLEKSSHDVLHRSRLGRRDGTWHYPAVTCKNSARGESCVPRGHRPSFLAIVAASCFAPPRALFSWWRLLPHKPSRWRDRPSEGASGLTPTVPLFWAVMFLLFLKAQKTPPCVFSKPGLDHSG